MWHFIAFKFCIKCVCCNIVYWSVEMIDCRKGEKKMKCRNIFLIEVFNFEWKFYLEFTLHLLYQMERLLYPKGKSFTDLYNIWIQMMIYSHIKFIHKVFWGLLFQIVAGMWNISLHSEISASNRPHSKAEETCHGRTSILFYIIPPSRNGAIYTSVFFSSAHWDKSFSFLQGQDENERVHSCCTDLLPLVSLQFLIQKSTG